MRNQMNYRTIWVLIVIGLLVVGYGIQVGSPLRLNTESVVLLSMARSLVQGNGLTFHGNPTRFPPGYPLIIAGLDAIGAATSSTFVATNLLFLFGGLAAAFYVVRYPLALQLTPAMLVIAGFLLSWVVIKHVSQPLTDIPYFGVSMGGLFCAEQTRRRPGRNLWLYLALTICLFCWAISIRTVGIALVPAINGVAC
jgi:hypothetical protein